jgi:D-serine deaminase-like pyridoxal phosphate-dependent protein
MSYVAGSDEFGTISYEDPSRTCGVGGKVELIVSHCDPVVNLYNRMFAIRGDKVETVWPVAARGMSL